MLVGPLIEMLACRCAERADDGRVELRSDYDCERRRNEANEMALVGIGREPGPTDLKSVRAGIGQALQTLYSDVLREEVPNRIAELLKQLDRQKDAGST
jgi:hypothetical protein